MFQFALPLTSATHAYSHSHDSHDRAGCMSSSSMLPHSRAARSAAQYHAERVPLLMQPAPEPSIVGLRAATRRLAGARTWPSTIAFALALTVYLAAGVVCLTTSQNFPPRGTAEALAGATCLEAYHEPHYAVVRIFMGTPARAYRLLVRPDTSMRCGISDTSFVPITIINGEALHSRSASCGILHERDLVTTADAPDTQADPPPDVDSLEDEDPDPAPTHRCVDVAIVNQWVAAGTTRDAARDARQRRRLKPIAFSFGASQLAGSEALDLGLDGEIYLCRSSWYALSARELCAWDPVGSPSGSGGPPEGLRGESAYAECSGHGRLPVERTGDGMAYNGFGASPAALRAAGSVWAATPAAHEACGVDTSAADSALATLFPGAGFVYQTFWAQSSAHVVDDVAAVDQTHFEDFRAAVEVGGACAALQTSAVVKARAAFELSCASKALIDGWGRARTEHCTASHALSVPYSRVATHRLEMRIDADGRGCFLAIEDRTLASVASAGAGGGASDAGMAWTKLLCVILAAAIMWSRREDSTDRADAIFGRCVDMLLGTHALRVYDFDRQTMLLGLLAALTRIVLAAAMYEGLSSDRLGRVALTELVIGTLAIVHWFVLYMGEMLPPLGWIKVNGLRPTLGGSSAIVDVSCATMLAFSAPPVRVDRSTFDVVARLLTAVLIAITCISRTFLSAACAGLLARSGRGYAVAISVTAASFWVLQAASVAVVLVDLFAVPTSIDWTRARTGERWLAATVLFLGATLGSAPRLTANAVLIAKRMHKRFRASR